MAAFSKILVPVDLSSCSAKALAYALMIGRSMGAAIVVVHAYEVPSYVPPHATMALDQITAPVVEHAQRIAEHRLKEFLLSQNLPDTARVQQQVVAGPAGAALIDLLDTGDFDLVVMGTHGRTGVARLFLGSVAAKLVREAHCPVMTVKA